MDSSEFDYAIARARSRMTGCRGGSSGCRGVVVVPRGSVVAASLSRIFEAASCSRMLQLETAPTYRRYCFNPLKVGLNIFFYFD